MSSCATRLVSSVTRSASFTTGLPSWSTSSAGEVRRKIAAIGSSRKASVTTVASARTSAKGDRCTPRLLLLHARQKTGRDQLRLAGFRQHAVDENLGLGLA